MSGRQGTYRLEADIFAARAPCRSTYDRAQVLPEGVGCCILAEYGSELAELAQRCRRDRLVGREGALLQSTPDLPLRLEVMTRVSTTAVAPGNKRRGAYGRRLRLPCEQRYRMDQVTGAFSLRQVAIPERGHVADIDRARSPDQTPLKGRELVQDSLNGCGGPHLFVAQERVVAPRGGEEDGSRSRRVVRGMKSRRHDEAPHNLGRLDAEGCKPCSEQLETLESGLLECVFYADGIGVQERF